MVKKLDRVMTELELLPIKSRDPLFTWSCEITRQIKNISPLSQCIWPSS